MPHHYLSYWRPESVEATLIDAASDDAPVDHGASSQYHRLTPGDTLWILTAWEGERPALVARIVVGAVTNRAGAARKLGVRTAELYPAKHHVVATKNERYPLRDIDLTPVLPTLTWAPASKAVADREDARPTVAERFRTMRALSPAGARTLVRLWNAAPPLGYPFGSIVWVERAAGGFTAVDYE